MNERAYVCPVVLSRTYTWPLRKKEKFEKYTSGHWVPPPCVSSAYSVPAQIDYLSGQRTSACSERSHIPTRREGNTACQPMWGTLHNQLLSIRPARFGDLPSMNEEESESRINVRVSRGTTGTRMFLNQQDCGRVHVQVTPRTLSMEMYIGSLHAYAHTRHFRNIYIHVRSSPERRGLPRHSPYVTTRSCPGHLP